MGLNSQLTLEDFKRIHGKREAVENAIYVNLEGLRYIGEEDGRLSKIHTIKGEVTGDLEDCYINHIGSYTRAELLTLFGSVDTSLMTPGSVVFIGASLELAQDNANFFYDDTNDRVGIGTNTPNNTLQVAGNVTIGDSAAGVDYTLTFDGESNDGIITWMEDEDYFRFADSIHLPDDIQIIFGDSDDATIEWFSTAAPPSLTINSPFAVWNGDFKHILGATDYVYLDARTTPHTFTGGVLDIDMATATTNNLAIDIDITTTATTGIQTYGILTTIADHAVVTGTNQDIYGHFIGITKDGVDTSADTCGVTGIGIQISNMGSTGAGTKVTRGVDVYVDGDTAGTSSTSGIYLYAQGADTNTGVHAAARSGTTTYALYADAQSGTTNYALYTLTGSVSINHSVGEFTNIVASIVTAGANWNSFNVDTTVSPTGANGREHRAISSQNVLNTAQNLTSTTGGLMGMETRIINNNAGVITKGCGSRSTVLNNTTGSFLTAAGVVSNIQKVSTGQITTAIGFQSLSTNVNATSSIGTLIGFSDDIEVNTGTITDRIGIQLASTGSATNNWALDYSADFVAGTSIKVTPDSGATTRYIHTSLSSISSAVNRTAVGAGDYNPSILTDDYIIAVDDTAAARAVIISTEDEDSGTPTVPRIMVVKDESGGAAANNITITLESGGTIDGGANEIINANYGFVTLYMDGTNAWLI